MNPEFFPNLTIVQQYWTRTLARAVWGPWILFDSGLKAAQTVLNASSAPAETVQKPEAAYAPDVIHAPEAGKTATQELLGIAVKRMNKGLAPPREIYQTPHRNQIDWSQFPEWARPSDPELFEGSAHEG
jgi:hypothetical protein